MTSDDANPRAHLNLLAALADAEVLRHDLAAIEALRDAERRHAGDVVRELEALRQRLVEAGERQRELHVLLLHRDQEIARLHEYLPQAPAPAQPPEPPIAPPSLGAGVGTGEPPLPPAARALQSPPPPRSELAAAVVAAVEWWDWLGMPGGRRPGSRGRGATPGARRGDHQPGA